MSGKVRQKTAANAAENASLSLNERILKECHSLYTDSENGNKSIDCRPILICNSSIKCSFN
jgi:hypothetical protein